MTQAKVKTKKKFTGMRTGTLSLFTRHGRGEWYAKRPADLLKEAKKKFKPANELEELSLQRAIEKAHRNWTSYRGKTILFSWHTYPNVR